MGFLSDIFNSFFKPQSSSELILRKIAKDILKDNPKYYNPKKDIIYKNFAKDLFFLKNELSYFKKPLEHLFSKKETKEIIVKNILIDFLDKETNTYFNLLETNNIEKVIEKYGLKKSKEYYNKLFSILKQKITTSLLNQIDKIISEFKNFFDIVDYNFNNILSLFDVKLLSNVDPKYSPSFEDIKVSEKFKEYLADFNFLNINFNPDNSFEIYLQKFLSRYFALNNEKFSNNLFRKKLKNILEVLKIRFDPLKIEKYLQYLFKSPEFKTKIVVLNDKIAINILEEKINKAKSFFEKYENNLKLKNLDHKINQLFNKIDFIKANYYNDNYSNIFLSTGLYDLKYVKPYQIIKTFLIIFFEGKYKNLLLNLIYKAVFLDDNLNTGINQTNHNLSDSVDKINKFENEASILEKTYNQILKKPENFLKNKTLVNIANQEINDINEKALKLIREIFENFYFLNKLIKEILKDYKEKKSIRIKNLISSFDENFINEFLNFSKNLDLLEEIIKELIPATKEIEEDNL